MRVPRTLAWLLLGSCFFTAGLLRRFHDSIPSSPYVSPVVGSLLFAAIFLLLLVTARERGRGAVRGTGVRLGSLTPLMLMLLIEKWFSITVYPPLYAWLAGATAGDPLDDARYRAFAGLALLAICLLLAGLSPPAARRTWRRASPRRWPLAAAITGATIVVGYLVVWGLAGLTGAKTTLWLPEPDRLWVWVFGGQTLRAFSEEIYYRGLLLFEMQRLAPRLGAPAAGARRWIALLFTSTLFGMEHVTLAATWGEIGRRLIFTVSLGLLLGIVVLISNNLHLAAGLHAWINWVILGASPRFVDVTGEPVLAPGAYIGVSLSVAFVFLFLTVSRRARRDPAAA